MKILVWLAVILTAFFVWRKASRGGYVLLAGYFCTFTHCFWAMVPNCAVLISNYRYCRPNRTD